MVANARLLLALALLAALVFGPDAGSVRIGLAIALAVVVAAGWVLDQRSRAAPGPDAAVSPPAGGAPPATLHDPLTRLPGRQLLHELLSKQLAQARRSRDLIGVLVCDLDRFKALNDSRGQAAGDELLAGVASRLAAEVREADLLGRTGGDEFTLVVTRARQPEDVMQVAQRVLACFEEAFTAAGRETLVSTSLGVSLFPADGEQAGELLGNAEVALRQAKARGGNCLQLFTAAMNRRAHERTELGQELRYALRRRQLVPHFQPQVALADGRITGMEALVRWPHPERGLLSAGAFIALAEESGLMPDLGAWLIGEICRCNAGWRDRGLPAVPVSVNVSIRQFQGGDVAAVVAEALAASGLPPELLHLEITESIAMLDAERMSKALARLREMGVKIHLDDFGTGYSSLSYLLHYPVDVLKIDRSFVAGVPASEESAMIVRLTLALGRRLGLGVIAEGVETAAQLAFLRDEGCPTAQGFLLGRPLPPVEFEKLLAAGAVALEPPPAGGGRPAKH